MGKNKESNRSNITTIIHDLKTEYSHIFREKFPADDKKLEAVIIGAARLVKKRKVATWSTDKEGNKVLKITDRPNRFLRPKTSTQQSNRRGT